MSLNMITYVIPEILLCLNGELPAKTFFEAFPQTTIIVAADGAAKKLRGYNILPHSIVGDLDSIGGELTFWEGTDTVIYKNASQDSTDFEKSLEYISRFDSKYIVICGFSGGNLDHTLNNWSTLQRSTDRYHLCIDDGESCALPIRSRVAFDSIKNALISLIPQPYAVITTEGLEWNLKNERLEMGGREGARNRARDSRVTITVHEGSILLFVPSKLPYMPIA
jgi:thiamine pyrophosphokinase